MWCGKYYAHTILILAIGVGAASARPIRVHQPTAVTSPPTTHLSPEQIDYLLKQYAAVESAAATHHITPAHHDYVSVDSAYIKSTNPRLRATAATRLEPAASASGGGAGSEHLTHDSYFVPTTRPGTKASIAAGGFDFYFPLSADDVRADDDQQAALDAQQQQNAAAAGPSVGVEELNLMYLRHMQPPVQPEDDEPNYYAVLKVNGGNKKAPLKKYNSTKKQVNLKGSAGKASVVKLQQQQQQPPPPAQAFYAGEADEYAQYVGQATQQHDEHEEAPAAAERLTPRSQMRMLRAEELNTGEYLPSVLRNGNKEGQRIAYQQHGFSGPQSYRFGYDTGKGENRQFHVEQRDKEGNVVGEYGYKDGRGKMNVYKYTSSAAEGFRSEKMQ